ncbi:FMN-dependent dehydrogenase-domain-containing protein [Aspergillus sergii]|uniref:FMN-dependent dehydrogenase-domain-containing protein n=1 Tax=Aspergillus sergii TaxID=1034303 RepID=A0A5N6XFB9_9EURO|nr:FMN-dependent dehydrogenase-domain-containing protein [Aspergillus sergii]
MMLTVEEVAQHNTRDSCWVIIRGYVYDVTDFLSEHPGGTAVILRFAGQDATVEYDLIHPPRMVENELPPEKHLGPVAKSCNLSPKCLAPAKMEPSMESTADEGPPLSQMIGLNDFEAAAKYKLTGRAWVYYSSSAESMRTYTNNLADWSKVTFRPRVLRDVRKVDTHRTILGQYSNLPIFIAPCALGRLGHPEGEHCLVRGAARFNIPYAVSMGSSTNPEDLIQTWAKENKRGSLMFQLYVKKDFNEVRATVQRARSLGFKALMVTVDTPVVGKREEDDKFKAKQGLPSPVAPQHAETISRGPYSSSFNWNDLGWIAKEWGNNGPLCLKGLTTAEDVKAAADLGFTSLYISNHGGRQLDGAPSGLHVLMEIRRFYPDILQSCEVLLDGGVRRGTDVLKALALGASAVGLGRPFMYALSTHGTDGVCRALDILTDEIKTNMRLLGVTRLEQLNGDIVNTRLLEQELVTSLNEQETASVSAVGRPRACI